jgi:hypothetical protein
VGEIEKEEIILIISEATRKSRRHNSLSFCIGCLWMESTHHGSSRQAQNLAICLG